MFDFKTIIRCSENTTTQKAKAEAISKLMDKIAEGFDPLTVTFQDKVDAMAEWFSPSKGKIRSVTQHWDTSVVPASGVHLIVSTRGITMKDLFLINRFLKKDVKHG